MNTTEYGIAGILFGFWINNGMRFSEFNKPKKLYEFVLYFDQMQGSNLIGITQDGQQIAIDTNRYQLDLPQSDETDKITITDKRSTTERSSILRKMKKGTPIEISVSGTFTVKSQ